MLRRGFQTGDLNHAPSFIKNGNFVLNEDSPQAQDLIGWWPDASIIGGKLRDYSKNANHGSVVSGMTTNNLDLMSEGILVPDYAGTDHAYDMGNLAIMDAMPALTFSCRFRLNATFAPGFQGMCGKWNDASADRTWVFAIAGTAGDDDLNFFLMGSSGGTLEAASGVSTQASVVGKTTLITGLWDTIEDRVRVYINGVEEPGSTTGITGDPTSDSSSRSFMIGRQTSLGSGFDGPVFDVRAYDRKMLPWQVLELQINPWDLWYETGRVSHFFVPAAGSVFPSIPAGQTTSEEFSGNGPHEVAPISGMTVDNILILAVCVDGTSTITLDDFTPFANIDQTTVSMRIGWRKITGSEPATYTISHTGGSEIVSTLQYEVQDAEDPTVTAPIQFETTGVSTNADPPDHTTGGGGDNHLFMAIVGVDRRAVTGFPGNMTVGSV